jgi:phosphatidylserine/phosphatidylglycerophosphate/cardiolipin synthase-like enzyme
MLRLPISSALGLSLASALSGCALQGLESGQAPLDAPIQLDVTVDAAEGGPQAGRFDQADFTLEQATATLILVNFADEATLRSTGAYAPAIPKIIAARPIRTMTQLAYDVEQVGTATLQRLRDFAMTWPERDQHQAPGASPGLFSYTVPAVIGGPFTVSLDQSTAFAADLLVRVGDQVVTSAIAEDPSLDVAAPPPSASVTVTVRNYGADVLQGVLTITPGEAPPTSQLVDAMFTDPQCDHTGILASDDFMALGTRVGAWCDYSTSDVSRQRSFGRSDTNLHDRLVQVIRSAADYKRAHPDQQEPVTLTMAYLSWYTDYGLKGAVLDAIQAGVRFRGYFDPGYGYEIVDEIEQTYENDPAHDVTIAWIGSWESGRLMHVKVTTVDYGVESEPMWIVFSSANLSSKGTALHFENFNFARVPRSSNFAQRHECAFRALEPDQWTCATHQEYMTTAEGTGCRQASSSRFESSYEACVAAIEAPVDERMQVFFTPDRDGGYLSSAERNALPALSDRRRTSALYFLIDRMNQATESVDMAIEHFGSTILGDALQGDWGSDTVRRRLAIDDQTIYLDGESSQGDNTLWWSKFAGEFWSERVGQRFVRTNSAIGQLMHNKYVVIDGAEVFTGAGNFTTRAFTDNYESFYYFRLPDTAQQYQRHFDHLFDDLGSRREDIPEACHQTYSNPADRPPHC